LVVPGLPPLSGESDSGVEASLPIHQPQCPPRIQAVTWHPMTREEVQADGYKTNADRRAGR
jgi:hypothetical protein